MKKKKASTAPKMVKFVLFIVILSVMLSLVAARGVVEAEEAEALVGAGVEGAELTN
ncbi:hypothetical protein CCACVL1_28332 [Corchorus capsularis]|uniref:Uncharacterized protein n=1 Tax=Corchorus capsularis TaxID=210143 RepID=A0A1R3G6X7_COCAP|nr:hypothetical protein CCACVL1_28332 [Corchorus capsularis]